MAAPGTGMAALLFGMVFGFIGYVGWQDPRSFARLNSALMRAEESDEAADRQRGYGRLLAGLCGFVGVLVGAWGLYTFFMNLFG